MKLAIKKQRIISPRFWYVKLVDDDYICDSDEVLKNPTDEELKRARFLEDVGIHPLQIDVCEEYRKGEKNEEV